MTKLLIGRVSAVRSKTMSAIRCKNTGPEMALRRLLCAKGLRYRLHSRVLPGRPDIVFPRAKVAVFCDGDFWHGRNWKKKGAGRSFSVRRKYWIQKIEGNMARDRRNNRELRKAGWLVLRFWETDIKSRRGTYIAAKIAETVTARLESLEMESGRSK